MMELEPYIARYLALIGKEREHILRGILQEQLGRWWLSLYYPEKSELVLPKMRGGKESKVA